MGCKIDLNPRRWVLVLLNFSTFFTKEAIAAVEVAGMGAVIGAFGMGAAVCVVVFKGVCDWVRVLSVSLLVG
jgi:hypothetical protein